MDKKPEETRPNQIGLT